MGLLPKNKVKLGNSSGKNWGHGRSNKESTTSSSKSEDEMSLKSRKSCKGKECHNEYARRNSVIFHSLNDILPASHLNLRNGVEKSFLPMEWLVWLSSIPVSILEAVIAKNSELKIAKGEKIVESVVSAVDKSVGGEIDYGLTHPKLFTLLHTSVVLLSGVILFYAFVLWASMAVMKLIRSRAGRSAFRDKSSVSPGITSLIQSESLLRPPQFCKCQSDNSGFSSCDTCNEKSSGLNGSGGCGIIMHSKSRPILQCFLSGGANLRKSSLSAFEVLKDSDAFSASPKAAGRFRSRDGGHERAGLTGLRNIGNTCFMNSVLQCLSNTKPLLEYVIRDDYVQDMNTSTSAMKGSLIRAFAEVIQELWREARVVDTSAFKDQIQKFAPRFMGYSQQDAQEFLRYLLEGLHEDVNHVISKPTPIHTDIDDSLSDSQKASEAWRRYLRYEESRIVDIFVGQLRSTLKCNVCGNCSVTFDPFWDLSLPIPARASSTKLAQCFELFTKEEILDGDEKPTCSKCQRRQKCTKSFSIQKFPRILVVHLKRFSPTERYRGKLSTLVECPINSLDLSPYAANRGQAFTYNLYGVANHSGSTYSGHYIAYCKHPYSGEWHSYNDSRVSPISTQQVISTEGYVLFYEQSTTSS